MAGGRGRDLGGVADATVGALEGNLMKEGLSATRLNAQRKPDERSFITVKPWHAWRAGRTVPSPGRAAAATGRRSCRRRCLSPTARCR